MPIPSKENESVIRSIPTKKSPEPNGFNDEFYQAFKVALVSILLKLLKKYIDKGIVPNLVYEVSFTMIAKSKNLQEKKISGWYPWWMLMKKFSMKH